MDDLVSIVVPCYNVEKYVKQCIDSIKQQTYKNIEVLMVDDGSKDNTASIIKDNIKDDNRFKYYYKNNGGLSDARNYALPYIKGKYITFVDSDDWIEPDYIKELYTSLVENDSYISLCDYIMNYKDRDEIKTTKANYFENFMNNTACIKMYKSSAFQDIRFPKGKWYEDLGTIPKIYMKNSKYSIVHKPLYNYRQNSDSITNTYDDRIFDIYYVIDDVEKYAKENGLYDKYYSNLEIMNIAHVLMSTMQRYSYHKDFSIKGMKQIKKYVVMKYPKWYKNKNIKKVFNRSYRVYLFFLRINAYPIIKVFFKLLQKKEKSKW